MTKRSIKLSQINFSSLNSEFLHTNHICIRFWEERVLVYMGMSLRCLHQIPWILSCATLFLSLSKFNACIVDKRLSSSVNCCRIESTIDCIIKEQNNNQNVIFNKTFLFQDIFIILKSNCESCKNHERCHSLGFLSSTS